MTFIDHFTPMYMLHWYVYEQQLQQIKICTYQSHVSIDIKYLTQTIQWKEQYGNSSKDMRIKKNNG